MEPTQVRLTYTDKELCQSLIEWEREDERRIIKLQWVTVPTLTLDPEDYFCFRLPKFVVSDEWEPAMFIAFRKSDVILPDTN